MDGMSLGKPLPPEDLEYVGSRVAALWPQLKGARLLMTGATGFFGRWLLESLLFANERHNLGVSVVALSRDPGAFLNASPHLATASLRWRTVSVATLQSDSFAGETFDMVIHLATEPDMRVTRASPNAAAGVIIDGTRRTLEVAARTGATRFLLTSTGAVYGAQPPDMERISEDYPGVPDPLDEMSPYGFAGEAKRQAELLCLTAARAGGLGAVIARCFTFAGPGLPIDGKFAYGNFMRDSLAGGPIIIKGDGTTVRSYLYSADLAVWLWTLLLRGVPGRAYNVGSEHALTLKQLAELMDGELGSKGITVLQNSASGLAPDRYVPSTHRARGELGLQEGFSLPQMIRNTASWHRSKVKH
jgi:nucleoside-diphosphate-sugar epimerase